MELGILNPEIMNISAVRLSIFILFALCVVLMVLVFIITNAYWRIKERFIEEKPGRRQHHKHHLTGLDTRPMLIENLESLIENSKVDKANLAVLFIDLDDFNNINTSLGIKLADSVLIHVSKVLSDKAKEFSQFIYHVGSDEFAIILYDYGKSTDTVAEITNGIIQAVSTPVSIEGYELNVSCCAGICVYPDCATDALDLIKHAGAARDNAKKIGYSSYSFYTEDMSKKSIMRTLISSDLREALQRNEFSLRYQPKVNLQTGLVQGAEALLRWHHPSLGNITPDIFIPVIEDLGLIHPIGKWVIYTACKDISRLHKEGFADLSISINLSAHQFNKGDIASIIAEAIWDSGIAPHKVELELTEAVVMTDTEKSSLMLKVLQSMGVKIAVDDFGTGYSSLNQLTRFPISILKIDRCFVHDMNKIPANVAIVATIIRMAKQLGFEVVAEGVETKEELELLRTEGCDAVQGFYYCKPLPYNEFVEYVYDKNATVKKAKPSQIEDKSAS